MIVRSGSIISGLADLKGKVLAITSEDEAGRIYLNTLLLQNNFQEISEHFSAIIEKRMFSQVILAVFFGQADACIATDIDEDI